MRITPFSVIELLGLLGLLELLEFLGLLESLQFTDFELNEHDKPNGPNKLLLAFQASASVRSFSLNILRFQVEI
jgi:hypothetical protein